MGLTNRISNRMVRTLVRRKPYMFSRLLEIMLNNEILSAFLANIVTTKPTILAQLLMNLDNDFLVTNYSPQLANIIKYMSSTGRGTQDCLDRNCLPVPVHFYSPIPDITELIERDIWNKKSSLSGVDFNIDRQIELLHELGVNFGCECIWPSNPTENPYDFYVNNQTFSYGCAASLHSIVRKFKPSKIVEIGSGNSSLIISHSIAMNRKESLGENSCQYTIVDPYPRDIICKECLTELKELIQQRVELVDPAFFDCLGNNDILFIDSSHSVKTGSDVNHLILEVLPNLASGVIVHFHDIHLPYEYPSAYAHSSCRMFWTEAYLLQAFLAQNEKYEVLLAMNYLMIEKQKEFRMAFSHYNPDEHKFISGSFWIRRK